MAIDHRVAHVVLAVITDAELSVAETARLLGIANTTALRLVNDPASFPVSRHRCRGCGGLLETAACRVCDARRGAHQNTPRGPLN